jgi:hypothetical protein
LCPGQDPKQILPEGKSAVLVIEPSDITSTDDDKEEDVEEKKKLRQAVEFA